MNSIYHIQLLVFKFRIIHVGREQRKKATAQTEESRERERGGEEGSKEARKGIESPS